MIGRLPVTLVVAEKEWNIRTDYRDILTIMEAYNDPELSSSEKAWVMLSILYVDWNQMPRGAYEDAVKQAIWFLDCGQDRSGQKQQRKLMDWEQDEMILFPAINKAAGFEVRSVEYLHWWSFMGYFMEIDEGTFSTVLGIRQKIAKGKKLEKWEQEFYRKNKEMCDLKTRYSTEEQEEIEYWNKLLG